MEHYHVGAFFPSLHHTEDVEVKYSDVDSVTSHLLQEEVGTGGWMLVRRKNTSFEKEAIFSGGQEGQAIGFEPLLGVAMFKDRRRVLESSGVR